MKTNVLKEMKKKAAAVHSSSMKEDKAKIAARSPKSLAWLQPGVVGEKDNCEMKIKLVLTNQKNESLFLTIYDFY